MVGLARAAGEVDRKLWGPGNLIKAAYVAPYNCTTRRESPLLFLHSFNMQRNMASLKSLGVAAALLVSAVSAQTFQRLGTCPTLGTTLLLLIAQP